jgi:hypothetical protein
MLIDNVKIYKQGKLILIYKSDGQNMYIVFKTSQGSIKVSGSLLIISALSTLFLLTAVIKATGDVNKTGDTGSITVVMNVTVTNIISVNISPALQKGILFLSIASNTNNRMAQNDSTGTGNVTEYWVGNDPSTSGNISLWHYALNLSLNGISTTNVILIGNVTHESNKTKPDVSSNVNMTNKADGAIAMTTTWKAIGIGNCSDVQTSNSCYIAYWLDVPATIPGGTYNTTYNYCGNLSFSSATCG